MPPQNGTSAEASSAHPIRILFQYTPLSQVKQNLRGGITFIFLKVHCNPNVESTWRVL